MSVIDRLIQSARFNNANDGDDEEMDDDYYEDDQEDEEDEGRGRGVGGRFSSLFGGRRSNRGRAQDEDEDPEDYNEPAPAPARAAVRPTYTAPARPAQNQVGPQRQRRPQAGLMQMKIIKPSTFEQARQIADMLLDHRAVILNLEGLDVNTAQRIVDFASGSCYALHGNFMSVSKFIIAISPEDISIDSDMQENQQQSGNTTPFSQGAAAQQQPQQNQNTFNAADSFAQSYGQNTGNGAGSYGSPYYGNN